MKNEQLKDPYKLEYIETTELIKNLYLYLRLLTDYIKTHRHHPYWLCMQVKQADQYLRETEKFSDYHLAPNYLEVLYRDWSE
jgi:hypothetical protein